MRSVKLNELLNRKKRRKVVLCGRGERGQSDSEGKLITLKKHPCSYLEREWVFGKLIYAAFN